MYIKLSNNGKGETLFLRSHTIEIGPSGSLVLHDGRYLARDQHTRKWWVSTDPTELWGYVSITNK